jgi:hypothetical protein
VTVTEVSLSSLTLGSITSAIIAGSPDTNANHYPDQEGITNPARIEEIMERNAGAALDEAIRLLRLHGSSIVLMKDWKIVHESKAKGIVPYIEVIESQGHSLKGAALADRIAGRAVALLSAYIGVDLAYAETVSEGALEVFANHNIPIRYDKRVPMILNRDKNGQCPFERIVSDVYDPEEAFQRLMQAIKVTK